MLWLLGIYKIILFYLLCFCVEVSYFECRIEIIHVWKEKGLGKYFGPKKDDIGD
jgi:hypothetical protein